MFVLLNGPKQLSHYGIGGTEWARPWRASDSPLPRAHRLSCNKSVVDDVWSKRSGARRLWLEQCHCHVKCQYWDW